jgi:outer membrane protein assembly factor BamE
MSAPFNHSARRYVPLALALVVASATLAGCGVMSGAGNLISPYRHDVVQGNFVSKEQVAALRAGMSRQQVRDVLGAPLLASMFHADRWDYVFTLKRQNVESQQFRLAVFFKGDLLARFDGDAMPSESEFVDRLDGGRKGGKIPALEASEADLSKFPPAAPAVRQPPAATGPLSYPPLEPPAR